MPASTIVLQVLAEHSIWGVVLPLAEAILKSIEVHVDLTLIRHRDRVACILDHEYGNYGRSAHDVTDVARNGAIGKEM